MAGIKLEDVFKLSGAPTYTFVEPVEYSKLLVALRTPGRGVVIEGPSGIGKTTAVKRALDVLGLDKNVLLLSARKSDDRDLIRNLSEIADAGTVIIDDFHHLDEGTRSSIADYMKVLADEEAVGTKIVILGINRAGQSLVAFAHDLSTRLDVIRFEANPESKVLELISKGEQFFNVSIACKDDIKESANGSFFIAQMLCHETCLAAGVLESRDDCVLIEVSHEIVKERVMDNLSLNFIDVAVAFASGSKLRREGRAPYLHILRWLAEASEWSVALDREIRNRPEHRGSVGQVVEKGHLERHMQGNARFKEIIHYNSTTYVISVEDPKFVFFIKNLLWNKFAERVGFLNVRFDSKYDFALSFAGVDRPFAELLFAHLSEMELSVFYDKNEQHRILAEDVEQYLAPIYRSEAALVVCFLGPEYPNRIWTKFESEQFKSRFGENAVIPIWFTTARPGMFDETTRVGGVTFDPNGDVESQILRISEDLRKKMGERRHSA